MATNYMPPNRPSTNKINTEVKDEITGATEELTNGSWCGDVEIVTGTFDTQ